MTDKAFRVLVAEMRRLQKEYFKTRDTAVLKVAKGLEYQVDEALKGNDFNGRNLAILAGERAANAVIVELKDKIRAFQER